MAFSIIPSSSSSGVDEHQSLTYIDIPDDIVIEILSRISAKCLLRLRWACKYWFNLITRDGTFIKKHYNLLLHKYHTSSSSISNDDDDRIINNTSFMLYDFNYILPVAYTMNMKDMINNRNDESGTLVNMDVYNLNGLACNNFNAYYSYIDFGGSCNGLILLIFHRQQRTQYIGNNKHFLWNPCTREFKELPCDPANTKFIFPSLDNIDNIGYTILGFGYDQTFDDYKVLAINISNITTSQLVNDHNADIDNLHMEISIYKLGSNSWSTKVLTDPLVKAHWKKLKGPGFFNNGALHWIKQLQEGSTFTIIAFDITKEELGYIEGPAPRNFFNDCLFFNLTVLNGCLCILQWKSLDYVDIWIMKDYGVKDSWTKLFSINMDKVVVDTCSSAPYYSLSGPNLLYLKDDGILMLTDRRAIVASDLKKNNKARFIYSIRDVSPKKHISSIGDDKWKSFVETYIESLVSLNSGKYSTLVESKTTTVAKQDLLEYEIGNRCLVKISPEKN